MKVTKKDISLSIYHNKNIIERNEKIKLPKLQLNTKLGF